MRVIPIIENTSPRSEEGDKLDHSLIVSHWFLKQGKTQRNGLDEKG